MTRPEHEIDAYLEGQFTDEQARAIDTWIAADPTNAADFLHLVRTHQMLGVIGKEQSLSRQAAVLKPDQLDRVTLASLAEMEAAAEPVPFSEVDQPFTFDIVEPKRKPQKSVDLVHAIDDLRWAAGKIAGRLIRSPYGITGAIAAILALGFLLFNPFGSSTPAPPQDFANTTPTKPAESAPPILRDQAVATLTAQHNALWAEGALAPGSLLRANQRLTLTAGFAEITTEEGAVVILEAPATIELLDNTNALRLHAGKLVGICETESSKGFVVRTPHMDITDLGTRFGVDASRNGSTSVHVIEGQVEVARRSAFDSVVETEHVSADQAVVSSASGLVAAAFEADRFASAMQIVRRTIVVPGQVAWFHHPLLELKESDAMQVYTEKRDLRLKDDLVIDLDGRGNRPTNDNPDGLTISAGTVVDVYLLQLDTPGVEEHIGRYVVTFDRPILGVIGKGERLDETDPLFAPGIPKKLGGSARGASEDLNGDDILSADGRTLNLTLRVARSYDQIRVLVAAENR